MSIDPQGVVSAAQETNISATQVSTVISLIFAEECTIPFIARYRKDRTGGLDEVQIAAIKKGYEDHIEKEKRRTYILETIKKMEKLTPELEKKINAANTLNQLEDIYAPYKGKKKSKGALAEEAGLKPLAEIILTQEMSMDKLIADNSEKFINPDKKINNFNDALNGACDIVIEIFAHDTEIKETLRADYWKDATIASSKKKNAEEISDHLKYKDYFEFEQKVDLLKSPKASHRFLALRRGMTQKVLRVEVNYAEEAATGLIRSKYFDDKSGLISILESCAQKAFKNYIHPSLDLEIKSELKKVADEAAIDVFGINLRNLLLQPYLGPKSVLGVDPGVVTGCKLAIVDNTGKYIVDTVIYPHPPKMHVEASAQIVEAMLKQFKVEHIAIGNGTYGRETLSFIEQNVPTVKAGKVKATMISESGASIYSASAIAREEFPDKDPTVRGAISIARRFQDPLAELVKIDAKSIGVGQYQHDVNQTKLQKSLDGVVENCVNFVGVDLNTASAPLLSFVSGIGPSVAKNIVKYRDKSGKFKSRDTLLEVSRFSPKVFQQAAGFLRIYEGSNPLDATFIHPEHYPKLMAWCDKKKIKISQLKDFSSDLMSDGDLKDSIGSLTLNDIVASLTAPSQDPRTEFQSTDFRKDISTINDLSVDEWYPGVVTNITQFGAFVDIGIKENGLLHISQIADKFVENALDELKVGETVKVRVMTVDYERKRISLSCKTSSSDDSAPPPRRKEAPVKIPLDKQQLRNNAFASLKDLKLK